MSAQKQLRDLYNATINQARSPAATRLLEDVTRQIKAEIQWQEGDGAFNFRELKPVTPGVARAELMISVDAIVLQVILSVRQNPGGGAWFASTNLADNVWHPVTVGGAAAELAKTIFDALKAKAAETAARA